jgi:hypothetical protein
LAIVHRDLIIALAARHKLPAVYFQQFFVNAGGLVAYGVIPSIRTDARRARDRSAADAARACRRGDRMS